ncbi:putative glycosyl [Golovinomyces cichoracearum]|uniref:Putative glycosyl n=1 Tax=Golovinomyces cichoracearum TaxID=62708 RepID=A0A420HCI6_9PEZI|nr:putative glycosyl [Golovinomyces cichoracearum]
MLKNAALQYYHTVCSPNISSLLELRQSRKSNFEGREHQKYMLVKWNEISPNTILKKIESNDVELALSTLVINLRNIRMNLSPEFHAEKILYAKLLQACRTHPAWTIACSTINEEDTAALINSLRSNVATWKAQNKPTIEQFPRRDLDDSEILFIDPRYFNSNSN